MADYLAQRRSLAGIVLLVDARHGLTPLDEQLLEFVAPRVGTGEVRLLLLLTKADKLSRREAQAALTKTQQTLGAYATEQADIGVTLFSSLTRQGLEDVALALRQWVQQP
jgi:GTP-binding protein